MSKCKEEQDNAHYVDSSVPSITVDGVEYCSDRFYLNRGVGDPPVKSPIEGECNCGARAPPPLLDRGRLVASLNLKAAIVASYNVAPSHIIKEYPSLFGPESTVPTLVLHGHKGLGEQMKKKRANMNTSQESSQSSAASRHSDERQDDYRYHHKQQDTKRARLDIKAEAHDGEGIICIDDSGDEDESLSRKKSEFGDDDDETDGVAIKEEEEPPEDAWLRKQNESIVANKAGFGKSVHFTEVLPTWLPEEAKKQIESLRRQQEAAAKDDDNDVIILDSDDEETPVDTRYGVEPSVVQRRQSKRGVHHPKYMILFETSGSVVIIVTSANLTPQHAVDASWVQRFEPSEAKDNDCVTNAMRCDGSDFGYVLANYLECQSLAARPGEMIPEVFLRRYLGLATLEDFRQWYNWNSKVHLIATVPGEYRGPQTATHLGGLEPNKTFLYGSQRVNEILCRLSGSASTEGEASQRVPWLPPELLSNDDRLIIQPTSFGGFWKQANLRDLIKLYYDHQGTDNNNTATSPSSVYDLLDQTDIVWPSRDFMAGIHGRREDRRVPSPDSVASIKTDLVPVEGPNGVHTDGSFCFLSSISFNTIEFPCISRMSMYEPSYPEQNPSSRSPHIKSFARVFEGNEYQLRQQYHVEKAQECLPWFMLTSACLSRGAQGEAAPLRAFDSDLMTYSNFELGVLFVSRLTGNAESDRLYCWKPNKCHCGQSYHSSHQNTVEMIHLPLPYSLRPRAYLDDKDETDLVTTPYFHEIPRGTGFVGQMARTPLGAKLAAAQL